MGTAVRALGSRSWHAVLAGRGVLALGGRDARKLLQGLVTSDVTRINETGPQHTAFLGGNGRVLHDAFFKCVGRRPPSCTHCTHTTPPLLLVVAGRYQTKPTLTTHGDVYYEGKEFEVALRAKKPGQISDELRKARCSAKTTPSGHFGGPAILARQAVRHFC